MNEEQAKAAAEATSAILTAVLSRLDKMNEIGERIADAQQQRLSEQMHANKNMLDKISQLLKGLAPPAATAVPSFPNPEPTENRCKSIADPFGIQCFNAAGHPGLHSAPLMWTDPPTPSTKQ